MCGTKAKVAERGRVTIPKALRRKLGLVPGTVLDFKADSERETGAAKLQSRGPVDAVFGMIGRGRPTGEWVGGLRDPA